MNVRPLTCVLTDKLLTIFYRISMQKYGHEIYYIPYANLILCSDLSLGLNQPLISFRVMSTLIIK